jgi:hypothetical protein
MWKAKKFESTQFLESSELAANCPPNTAVTDRRYSRGSSGV